MKTCDCNHVPIAWNDGYNCPLCDAIDSAHKFKTDFFEMAIELKEARRDFMEIRRQQANEEAIQ